jgi:hypothetical protein
MLAEVWRGGHFIMAPAVDGVHASHNQQAIGGKGGVCLAISYALQQHILDEGILSTQQAVWMTLDHQKFGQIGFIGIYAPKTTAERTLLWREIHQNLCNSFQWFFLGNSNMYEREKNHKGGTLHSILGTDAKEWKQLMRHFNLKNSFTPKKRHLRYSWDSLQNFCHNPVVQQGQDGERKLQRLDRIYSYDPANSEEFKVTLTILPGFVLLDPAPVIGKIESKGDKVHPSSFWMNIGHLADPNLQNRIAKMWLKMERKLQIACRAPDVCLTRNLKKALQIVRCYIWEKES